MAVPFRPRGQVEITGYIYAKREHPAGMLGTDRLLLWLNRQNALQNHALTFSGKQIAKS
ncbi:hypothetical protein [Mesorhizobium sp. M7A.F.Ce.TU.012.03.2.1]|uniref:hypothetical protein n=1 Tax=Mesorhizobium sp. M7A.F.Ce.TU.012.03.2.1 TaxID=2493681 RepID=UPI0013E3F0BE|nr:hypothetical protein [Mesorhizobium sp. M7A.F.Ce.TU.012.03.2.1]